MRNYAQSLLAVNSPDDGKQHVNFQDKNKILLFDVNSVKWAGETTANISNSSARTEKEVGSKKNRKPSPSSDANQFPDDKDEYINAIRLWVSSIRLDEAMERKELSQLEGIQRLIVLSKGLLPNIIRLCRRAKRADTRLGVLAIIHLCADNDDGLCRLSVARFAQLLCRKENCVREAISDLGRGGEIQIEQSSNGNSYWPRIPVAVAHMNPSVGWIIDALSDKPRTVGRPSKKYPPLTQGVLSELGDDEPPLSGKNRTRKISHNSAIFAENTPPLRSEIPPPYAGTYTSKLNHSEEEITINRGDSRYSSTREEISRSGCRSSDGNGEVR
jgi:hypothetical protein